MTVAAAVEHRAVPSDDDLYDGPPRCACGSWYPCDAVRARVRNEHEAMMEARREHAAAVEARRIGVAVLVTIGCEVYSKTRRQVGDDVNNTVPVGGVLVAISEGERDADTGFIPRRFTVIDPRQRPDEWEHVLDEAEVDFELTTAANNGRLVALITRLQEAGGKRKARILTPREGRMIEYERALKSVILP